jgi:hypothetical protein
MSCSQINSLINGTNASSVTGAMNLKMYQFTNNLDPRTPNSEKETIRGSINGVFADNGPEISWQDVMNCGYSRANLIKMGYNPTHLTGRFMEGKIFKQGNSPTPVYLDYIINPDLFVTLLLLIFIALIINYHLKHTTNAKRTNHSHS